MVEEAKTNRKEECSEELKKVLDKYKCTINSKPIFKLRDDGTWSIVTVTELYEIPLTKK